MEVIYTGLHQTPEMIAEAALQEVLAILPSMKSPTISELAGGSFYAVETVVDKATINTLIPQLKARLTELTVTPMVFNPAEFGAYMTAETEKWAKVIKLAGIKAE